MHPNRRSLLAALVLVLFGAALLSCKSASGPVYGAPPVVGELNGGLATTGSQFAHTFTTAGTFNYKCANHPTCTSLQGTIVVMPLGSGIKDRVLAISQSGGSADIYGTPLSCSSLSLTRDSVFVGDVVTWTNTSAFPHTVTSR